MKDPAALSRFARLREAGEERYCRALEATGRFVSRHWTYFAIIAALLILPALFLPTFNSSSLCMLSALFQVITVWVIFQVAIAALSYFALQTVNVWPFWLMLFLHLFSTGAMMDKFRLEGVYCNNILAIRMIEETRGATRYP